MPAFASGVILGAYQEPSTAPANSRPRSCCIKKPRGVWHSPQCAGPLARYLPRFHSADFDGSGVKGFALMNSAFQNAMEKRRL